MSSPRSVVGDLRRRCSLLFCSLVVYMQMPMEFYYESHGSSFLVHDYQASVS